MVRIYDNHECKIIKLEMVNHRQYLTSEIDIGLSGLIEQDMYTNSSQMYTPRVPSHEAPPIKDYPSYQARFLMH